MLPFDLPRIRFNSLKPNFIFCPFHALFVSYLLAQAMIDQLICCLYVYNEYRRKKDIGKFIGNDTWRNLKEASFNLPLSVLVLLKAKSRRK